MRTISTLLFSVFIFLMACSNPAPVYQKADDPIIAAREFLESYTKGEFKKAAFYMVKDEANNQLLESASVKYKQYSESERAQLMQASITFYNPEAVTDSVTVIPYKVSLEQKGRKLKVIKQHDEWLVDFTYTFNGNL